MSDGQVNKSPVLPSCENLSNYPKSRQSHQPESWGPCFRCRDWVAYPLVGWFHKMSGAIDMANWRLDRAVRRIIRRDILRDCRTRFRAWKKAT